jgi:hypothetical protein
VGRARGRDVVAVGPGGRVLDNRLVAVPFTRGDVQAGGLLQRQAGEVAQLHQFRLAWVLGGQPAEGLVQEQDLLVVLCSSSPGAATVR